MSCCVTFWTTQQNIGHEIKRFINKVVTTAIKETRHVFQTVVVGEAKCVLMSRQQNVGLNWNIFERQLQFKM
jgi:hypothetical protein